MKLPSGQRLLAIYAGVLTLVFAGVVLMGATSTTRDASFDQITVRRINVVEPDGTLRMVISDGAEAPGSPYHGKSIARPDREDAGVIFMNNEGTEEGGLIYGGRRHKDGKVSSFGHLSFDNYDQDQTLLLQAYQDDTTHKATYLQINDLPYWNEYRAMLEERRESQHLPAAQQHTAMARFLSSYPKSHHRVFLGTMPDRSSNLVLDDADGRPRIKLQVSADGTAVLQFLNADGKVIQQLPSSTKPD